MPSLLFWWVAMMWCCSRNCTPTLHQFMITIFTLPYNFDLQYIYVVHCIVHVDPYSYALFFLADLAFCTANLYLMSSPVERGDPISIAPALAPTVAGFRICRVLLKVLRGQPPGSREDCWFCLPHLTIAYYSYNESP